MFTALLLFVACPPEIPYKGTGPLHEYFPMDGDREALYYYASLNAGDTGDTGGAGGIGYNLNVNKIEPVELIDGAEVVTWEYVRDDTGELIGQVKWASDDGDGIRIIAYAEGAGEFTTFDTPVQLTSDSDYMHVQDTVTTDTNGATWTGTYVEMVDITVQWGLDWEGAVHMHLDDGDGDDATGVFFAGHYWLVTRYGPGWLQLTGNEDIWDLADYSWEPEE